MPRKKMPKAPCSIEGCERPSQARTWCKTHWMRWKTTGDPNLVRSRRRDPFELVMRRVDKTDGCWLFTGCLTRHGYGNIGSAAQRESGGSRLTHVIVYERLVGSVPEGLELDHLCRVPACCNPDHLEPVTHTENVRRGRWQEGRRAWLAAKPTCRHGHVRSPENTYVNPSTGHKSCRPCKAEWARKKAAA